MAEGLRIESLRSAAGAYLELLRRLERDDYLTTSEGGSLSGMLLPEMAAYAAAVEVRRGGELEAALRRVFEVFAPEEPALEEKIHAGVRRRTREFLAAPQELPDAYRIIDRFDAMALAYEGAFYRRLGVEVPGRLTERYIELAQGFGALAAGGLGALGSDLWAETITQLRTAQTQAAL